MYYITKRDSETGKKFLELKKKLKDVSKIASNEAIKFGSSVFYSKRWAIEGGLEAIIITNGTLPDGSKPIGLRLSKEYGKKDVYVPNLKIKEGKLIKEIWDKLPLVTKKELNEIVNHKEDLFSNIGYNYNNKDYVGFIVDEKWNVSVPSDCEEITTKRFKELFLHKN